MRDRAFNKALSAHEAVACEDTLSASGNRKKKLPSFLARFPVRHAGTGGFEAQCTTVPPAFLNFQLLSHYSFLDKLGRLPYCAVLKHLSCKMTLVTVLTFSFDPIRTGLQCCCCG